MGANCFFCFKLLFSIIPHNLLLFPHFLIKIKIKINIIIINIIKIIFIFQTLILYPFQKWFWRGQNLKILTLFFCQLFGGGTFMFLVFFKLIFGYVGLWFDLPIVFTFSLVILGIYVGCINQPYSYLWDMFWWVHVNSFVTLSLLGYVSGLRPKSLSFVSPIGMSGALTVLVL